MKLFWASIFFVSIFAILVSNQAYATNGFEQVNWRLSHNPLICSFEPTPSKFLFYLTAKEFIDKE